MEYRFNVGDIVYDGLEEYNTKIYYLILKHMQILSLGSNCGYYCVMDLLTGQTEMQYKDYLDIYGRLEE